MDSNCMTLVQSLDLWDETFEANCKAMWNLPFPKELLLQTIDIGCHNGRESVRDSNFLCVWLSRKREALEASGKAQEDEQAYQQVLRDRQKAKEEEKQRQETLRNNPIEKHHMNLIESNIRRRNILGFGPMAMSYTCQDGSSVLIHPNGEYTLSKYIEESKFHVLKGFWCDPFSNSKSQESLDPFQQILAALQQRERKEERRAYVIQSLSRTVSNRLGVEESEAALEPKLPTCIILDPNTRRAVLRFKPQDLSPNVQIYDMNTNQLLEETLLGVNDKFRCCDDFRFWLTEDEKEVHPCYRFLYHNNTVVQVQMHHNTEFAYEYKPESIRAIEVYDRDRPPADSVFGKLQKVLRKTTFYDDLKWNVHFAKQAAPLKTDKVPSYPPTYTGISMGLGRVARSKAETSDPPSAFFQLSKELQHRILRPLQ